ncbi:hypothetical protein HYQ44_001202 [Verticillium longisporum]|nr:hypothetical protein HYQ44_001202 [Verticillium longisporum]
MKGWACSFALPKPVHYGYKSVHDLPTPPSTSRLSPPLAYQEPARKRLPSIPRSHSPPDQHLMSAPHRGLPMPAAMTLPPQQSHASSASGPPPPPLPPASQPGLSSSISSLSAHAQHHLGQLPGPPPQWQGAEESMRSWLTAKAEEDRRKQEEERTKQESLRLEQRRIEADMLRTSLQGGIPPPIVPLVFAGMGGAVSPTALDIAQQYIASQGHGAHLQLMSTQGGQRSPEHRRDSQSHGKSASIQALILDTFQDYSLNAPRPSQLQLLIRLNVLDGLARNAEALGFPVKGLCADEFISPFNYQNGHRPSSQPSHPESLSPTAPQRTVRHHPWVDLFPLARLRDNILRGLDSGTIDEDELCSDLLNVEDTNWSDVKKPSLILWGEPWDIKGWEASAAFLRKWGWITQGCPELIEGTDYWRRIRGEQGIVFDVSDDGASTMATVNLVSALSESRT